MIKPGAFDLERRRFAGVTSIAKDELQTFGTVPNVELRAGLEGETFFLERFQHAHVGKEAAVVRQEGFADMETRKMFLLQHEHAFAGTGEKGGRAGEGT